MLSTVKDIKYEKNTITRDKLILFILLVIAPDLFKDFTAKDTPKLYNYMFITFLFGLSICISLSKKYNFLFKQNKGEINLHCKFSNNKNPYVSAQKKTFKLLKKYRKFGLNLSNLVFMQVESPLRPNDFFIKKVCLGAKNKKKICVGNINTYRDYSWITEVVQAIILLSKLTSKDFIISAGKKFSGKEILAAAYKLNKLDFKNYYSIDEKFYRKNESKILIGSIKNSKYLKKNFNFNFKIFGNKLIKKMYKSL